MKNLNLKAACLLELSGELTPAARRKLLEQITHDPAAHLEYEMMRERYGMFGEMPIPEPSALERKLIPARLKRAVHLALRQREKWAFPGNMLVRCAACIAVAVICAAGWGVLATHDRAEASREKAMFQVAKTTIEHAAPAADRGEPASSYDQAISDVEASIRQLQTESPTLASLHDRGLSNLLDELARVDDRSDDMGE